MSLSHPDENETAAKTLRMALRHHERFEQRYSENVLRAWREAKVEGRKRSAPRVKLGSRVQAPKLTPEQVARIGKLNGLLDS